ncbi:histidinol-phosphate transaminase [Actinomyces naeslundii]|uniref:histidinol-phosphate transaminase n=1 Tax=Actinomyces naeslundii TaxID=1655 RepID=UPI00094CB06D|nr:histidinol-phosphate transaminase [Actinomyces naeslundii]OLO83695.1 histidinol-phosphate transaminase [Actinomyces naeslundii]OLO88287.1 histidinol-phosphate transaminase [Actinomyces naeslundii]OLO92548.1 histidinol-phosphate transaminase [Actinomyces naeslundii]OMG08551.1 histidinol-phosphate transaminase [Actinomyces naeslundii]
MSANLPLRPDLEGEAPYGAPEIDVPVRLNVNENPYPPSTAVIESIATAVARAAQGLNRYPERDFPRLREALADYLEAESGVHLTPEQIWAANGSNEVMLHVLQAFGGPGRTCLTFTPTYSMYPEYARDSLTDYVTRPRREDFTLDVETAVAAISELRPAVVILASPNNPTGTALPLEDIDRILEAARGHGPMLGAEIGSPARASDCVVVIDEAYAEFRRPGVPSALELLGPANPHLAVTRTMSKAFGAAGLRLGYLAADRALVDALRVVRLPYHLSAVTQAAALAALSHRDELMAQVASLRDERDALVAWLRGRGLTAHESDANFVLFGPFPDRESVWQALLDAGILIRVVGPEGFLRASIGTPEEMERLRSALAAAIGG